MKNTNLQKIENLKRGILTNEQIDTLAKASVIPADTPPDIVSVFAATCAAHGLSPYKREIYLVKYGTQYNTIVGIDGLRSKAARTGQFAGREDTRYDMQSDGTYKTASQFPMNQLPTSATVTVYRVVGGVRCAFTKTVRFNEYAGTGGKWKSMPFNMLEKCAEAAALRMAFADETAGLYVHEEADAMKEDGAQAWQLVEIEELSKALEEEPYKQLDYEVRAGITYFRANEIIRKLKEVQPPDDPRFGIGHKAATQANKLVNSITD